MLFDLPYKDIGRIADGNSEHAQPQHHLEGIPRKRRQHDERLVACRRDERCHQGAETHHPVRIEGHTRGEVGAGVIFIAIGYNLGGPALLISVLTIVLNLILTGGFVMLVKKLALKTYTPDAD